MIEASGPTSDMNDRWHYPGKYLNADIAADPLYLGHLSERLAAEAALTSADSHAREYHASRDNERRMPSPEVRQSEATLQEHFVLRRPSIGYPWATGCVGVADYAQKCS